MDQIFTAQLPPIADRLFTLMGRRTKPVSKKQETAIAQKLRAFLLRTKPFLLGLGGLTGQLPQVQCWYALLEGLEREQLRAAGIRIRQNEDAFAIGLRHAQRLARPNRKYLQIDCYRTIRKTLEQFFSDLYQKDARALEEVFQNWTQSGDAEAHLQYVRQFGPAVRGFRAQPPRRPTDKLVVQLGNEYKHAVAYFEQRLRLLIVYHDSASGTVRRRAELRSLGGLIQAALNIEPLVPLTTIIDRNVRNALSHGHPTLDVNTGMVTFRDRHDVVTWRFDEFFGRTRCLTWATTALLEIEVLRNLFVWETLVYGLWGRVANASGDSAPQM